jgi:Rps23 Pro-64 3,4-dihydroxylase Tpa1-like proline 4-hydroxylase
MIKNIFPVNIYLKDSVVEETDLLELNTAVKTIFNNYKTRTGHSYSDVGDNEIPFFTKENLELFPVLKNLQEKFIDGFYELANSFEQNTLSREKIEHMVSKNSGKLPLMKKGDYKKTHNHHGACAFAVFYLSDVDNDKHGGKLILKDPSFHSNLNFHPVEECEIETKSNRLVIAPAYVWHEVSPYFGDEERITIVINLDY